jgi:hypothetical protein
MAHSTHETRTTRMDHEIHRPRIDLSARLPRRLPIFRERLSLPGSNLHAAMNFGNGALPVTVLGRGIPAVRDGDWARLFPCRTVTETSSWAHRLDRVVAVRIAGGAAASSRPATQGKRSPKACAGGGVNLARKVSSRRGSWEAQGIPKTREPHPRKGSQPPPTAGGMSPAHPPSGPQAHAANCAPWAAVLQSAAALPHSGTAPSATAISDRRTPGRTH